MTASWPAPVHDRRHPPFEPGNTHALDHGCSSPRFLDLQVAEFIQAGLLVPIEKEAAQLPVRSPGDLEELASKRRHEMAACIAWDDYMKAWRRREEATDDRERRLAQQDMDRAKERHDKDDGRAATRRATLLLTPGPMLRAQRDLSSAAFSSAAASRVAEVAARGRAARQQAATADGSSPPASAAETGVQPPEIDGSDHRTEEANMSGRGEIPLAVSADRAAAVAKELRERLAEAESGEVYWPSSTAAAVRGAISALSSVAGDVGDLLDVLGVRGR